MTHGCPASPLGGRDTFHGRPWSSERAYPSLRVTQPDLQLALPGLPRFAVVCRNPGTLSGDGSIPVCPRLCRNGNLTSSSSQRLPGWVWGSRWWDRGTRLEDSEDFLPGAEIRSLIPAPALATTPIPYRVSHHNNWGPVWIWAIENMNCPSKFGDRKCYVALAGFWRQKQGRLCLWGIVTSSHRAFLGDCRSRGVCGRMSSLPPHTLSPVL